MFHDVSQRFIYPKKAVYSNISDVDLPIAAATDVASRLSGVEISRATFWRYRQAMGWVGEGYSLLSPNAVEALAYFANQRRKGYSAKTAKAKTIEYLRGSNND